MGKEAAVETPLDKIKGVTRVISIHILLEPDITPGKGRVIAAEVANAVGTPVEVLFDIGSRTHSAKFD